MTDTEYVYRQDIQEKKATGRGIFHKKNGSKSKKCTLPSDYLSRKEKKMLNGECKIWDMKKFYSYEEFKQMPDDIQLQYCNSIINRYNVGLRTVGEVVFGKAAGVLYTYMRKKGLVKYVNKAPSGVVAAKGRARLIADITKTNPGEIKEIMSTEEPPKQDDISEVHVLDPQPEVRIYGNCKSIQVTMNDWDSDILDFLKDRFDASAKNIEITITVTTKEP